MHFGANPNMSNKDISKSVPFWPNSEIPIQKIPCFFGIVFGLILTFFVGGGGGGGGGGGVHDAVQDQFHLSW